MARPKRRDSDLPLAASRAPAAPGVAHGTFGKSLTNWLFPAYVGLIAAGFGLFMSGAATITGNAPSTERALFYSVNAATLTGFPYAIDVRAFTAVGRAGVLLLMTGGTLFSLVVGGLAMVRILRLPYTDRRVILASFAALAMAVVAGTAMGLVGGNGLFASLFLSVSAFGNGGQTLDHPPTLAHAFTHLALLPLAVLGGLGITVLMELVDSARRKLALSTHARVVLVWTAGVYVVGLALLLMLRWPDGGVLNPAWQQVLAGEKAGTVFNPGVGQWLISCSALAINGRTLGLPLEWATYLPRAAQWVLIGLMAVGAASAGTAGGIKVNTLAELYRGTRRLLRGEPGGRPMGIAMAWVAIYAGLAGFTQVMLLRTVTEMPADRVLFIAVSALSNVGLSHDTLSVTGDGLFTLAAAMFAGRVVPLLILWWLADTTSDADIAVG